MRIRLSRYVHLTPVGDGRTLVLHAVSQLRLVVDGEVEGLLSWFVAGRNMPDDLAAAPVGPQMAPQMLAGCLATLMEQGVLTDLDAKAEAEAVGAQLSALYGRDAGAALDAVRRAAKTGADPYWSVRAASSAGDLAGQVEARTVLFFGDCDLQMEADFLRAAAARRGLGLVVATAFPGDVRFVEEREHVAAVVGALRSRRQVAQWDEDLGGDPATPYLVEARQMLTDLRARTSKPIFLDGLPEPTLQPLGAADRGPNSHRNRFRRLNLALEALTGEFDDVHFVDVAAALGGAGARGLVDDGLVGFSHFGSPGWMLQRPKTELDAVYGLFPDTAPLHAALGGDCYGRERVLAETHADALQIVLGDGRRKCVVLDLDGVLWPGVLAETGAPFAWSPEISGPYSYVGLYFGLHEALKSLKRRGVLLACVSKNDEDIVRRLWTYPDGYPKERLLTLDDFVCVRINWEDKAQNIRSIAAELGFALSAFAFVDDHPVERARVRRALPEVHVLGEDPFALRRTLLEDPRFQLPRLTKEAGARTELVRAHLQREKIRDLAADPDAFIAELAMTCVFERPNEGPSLARAAELMQRTTQFNATGRHFSEGELAAYAGEGDLYICRAKDRYGDYGLVAACVLHGLEIIAFVMSCRVIGLGVDKAFLEFVLGALALKQSEVIGRIVETDRNGPVRHLYADRGFERAGEVWRLKFPQAQAAE